MKIIDHYPQTVRHLVFRWLLWAFLATLLFIEPAFAADEVAGWRSTYDEVMRWVNFAIFVFVIVKFARKPLADFLKGRKEEVADEIEEVDAKREEAQAAVDNMNDRLKLSSQRLDEIKHRIVTSGEKRKAQIIAEAEAESALLLKASKVKIKGQIANAKHRLRSEMIDQAIDMALKRLPDEITPSDNTHMVNDYLEHALPK